MDKPQEILCLTTTLKIIRLFCVFPAKNKEMHPGRLFFIKFLIMVLLCSVVLIGSLVHFINSIKKNILVCLSSDLSNLVSIPVAFIMMCSFLLRHKSAVRIYMILSNFEEFGKPINFDKYNSFYNKLSKYHFIYLEIMILIFIASEFKANNTNEVCGLLSYTWTPFDSNYLPIEKIEVFLQSFAIQLAYMGAGELSWTVVETVEHIVVRMQHVKHLFLDAIRESNQQARRGKFNLAVRYHNAVLDLEGKLSQSFGMFMFTHVAFTAPIMGIGIFGLLSGSYPPFLVGMGWFMELMLDCFAGQRLKNESIGIGTTIYASDWQKCDVGIKKDLTFVLLRCQKPMILRASSFGIMDYSMFLGILKASYSYITLLTQVA